MSDPSTPQVSTLREETTRLREQTAVTWAHATLAVARSKRSRDPELRRLVAGVEREARRMYELACALDDHLAAAMVAFKA